MRQIIFRGKRKDNSDKSYSSLCVRAGLLSADLYRKYRDYIPSYNDWVWLCTAWYCSGLSCIVRSLSTDRTFNRGGESYEGAVVRLVYLSIMSLAFKAKEEQNYD